MGPGDGAPRGSIGGGPDRLAGIVEVLAISAPYPDRGASVLVRVYVEARIAAPVHVDSTTETRPRGRRRALPPGGAS